MNFSLTWNLAERPAGPGQLPTPVATVYVDFDAITDGDGSSGAPRNVLPGLSGTDATVQPGTHIKCRGRLRSTTGNFGILSRAGTATKPVVYIGNDPVWGQAYIDGSVQLSPVACTSQSNALGHTSWGSLRRSDITGLGGNNVEDYLHCAYAGTDREPRYFSGYPQLSNEDAFDYTQFITPTSWSEVIWKPGVADPTSRSDFVAGTSRPRISIANADAWLVAHQEGYHTGDLASAFDTDAAPILVMRIYANKWFTARVGRCNSDGTANASGAYITPIDGQVLDGATISNPTGNASYTSPGDYAYRIFNLAKAIDTRYPGQYAMNPAAGWLIDCPVSNETLHRARGNSGIRIGAKYVWLHGFKICGLSRSKTVTPPAGASNGDALDISTGLDAKTVRVQRCHFPGFGSIGRPDNPSNYDSCLGAARYYNTYERSINGAAILLDSDADVRYNHVNDTAGGIRLITTHARNVSIVGNFIENLNDIHGNGITLYTNKYGVVVRGNLLKNVGRPIVSEMGASGYDTATYGPTSCIVEGNVVQASGYGTAAALRFQSSAELGIQVIDNSLDGGVTGDVANPAFSASSSLVLANNGPITGNLGVGAALADNSLAFWSSSSSNTNFLRTDAGGISLIASIEAMTAPPTAYAPTGVGHLAA